MDPGEQLIAAADRASAEYGARLDADAVWGTIGDELAALTAVQVRGCQIARERAARRGVFPMPFGDNMREW